MAIVNETFVKRYIHPGDDPIGKVIDSDDKVTIVGIVRDIRQSIYDPPLAEQDWPISQVPRDYELLVLTSMHLLVRTAGRPEAIVPDLRSIFHQLDPTLPFRTPETMNLVIEQALTFERLENWLFGTFAALAVLLSLVGLYGLISHEIEAGTRDIGVRIALGAARSRIFALVYGRVGIMLGVGVAVGLFGTWAVHKLIQTVVALKWEHDTAAITVVVGLFLVIAFSSGVHAGAASCIHRPHGKLANGVVGQLWE